MKNGIWEKGGHYFVTRNSSSLIAFSIPEKSIDGYRILASHSDSPSFKIKENPEITVENKYVKLNVERIGRNASVLPGLIALFLWQAGWSLKQADNSSLSL